MKPSTASHADDASSKQRGDRHVCPVWLGYVLANPLRRLFENPDKILSPYVQPGMKVLEVGCAMGYFSLPLARMVGPQGAVICLDVQEKMLERLRTRAERAGLENRIQTVCCPEDSLGLDDYENSIDFIAVIHVLHEVLAPEESLRQLHGLLRAQGKLLLLEPPGHVSKQAFQVEVDQATRAGLVLAERPAFGRGRAAVFTRS